MAEDVIRECDVATPAHSVVGCVRRDRGRPEYHRLGDEWLQVFGGLEAWPPQLRL